MPLNRTGKSSGTSASSSTDVSGSNSVCAANESQLCSATNAYHRREQSSQPIGPSVPGLSPRPQVDEVVPLWTVLGADTELHVARAGADCSHFMVCVHARALQACVHSPCMGSGTLPNGWSYPSVGTAEYSPVCAASVPRSPTAPPRAQHARPAHPSAQYAATTSASPGESRRRCGLIPAQRWAHTFSRTTPWGEPMRSS